MSDLWAKIKMNTGDKLIIERTTPYGVKLIDGSYENTSKAVRGFLKDKVPCEAEITEMTGKEITKLKVLGSTQEVKSQNVSNTQEKISKQWAINASIELLSKRNEELSEQNIEVTAKLLEEIRDRI